MIVVESEPDVSQQIIDEDKSEDGREPFWLLKFVGMFIWMVVLFFVVVVIATFVIGVISYILDPTFGEPIV